MSGAFDAHADQDAAAGHAATLRQNAVGFPVKWLRDDMIPFTVLGDGQWAGADVTVDVMIEAAGSGMGESRAGSAYVGVGLTGITTDAKGSLFGVTTNGSYFVAGSVADVYHGTFQHTGAVPTVTAGSWHTLRLNVTAARLTGWLDGAQLFSVTPGSARGAVGIGVRTFGIVCERCSRRIF